MTSRRTALDVGVAVLALLTGWVALFGWRGLLEEPGRFLGPALVGGSILAALGVLLRLRHRPWWQVLAVQCAALAVFMDEHVSGALNRWWLVPTPRSVEHTLEQLRLGAEALGTEYSPVPAEFPGVPEVLLVAALLLLLAIDLFACSLGKVPLAGLPVLVLWMFPISLLTDGLGWRVFSLTALLFIMLLATEQTRRTLTWGRSVAPPGDLARVVRGRALAMGAMTCAAAVVLPVFVPLLDHSLGPGEGEGSGPGDGRGRSVTVHNPFVDLRRDLVRPDRTPMLEATTDGDPRYLRFTVLDDFSRDTWRPSPRQLTGHVSDAGALPDAPGLSNRVPGRETRWHIRLLPTFATAWLPTPYPARSIAGLDDRWRFDPDTLDIADRDGEVQRGDLEYDVVGFEPQRRAVALHAATTAPAKLRRDMTRLPGRMPPVISTTARRVTAEATSDYERAVALQRWFRTEGGFRYDERRAPGSGLRALASFLTTDKVGYCEQFAAAFAVMARTLDIPSRVVVGFLEPEERGDDQYLYTSDNLHAWPEVYFSGQGWVRFEPTPATHTGAAPSWTDAQVDDPSSPSPTEAPTQAPTQVPRDRQDPTASTDGGGVPGWLLPSIALLVVLVGSGVPWLLRRTRRHRRLAAGPDPASVARGLWAELRAHVHDLGLEWPEGRSVRRTAAVLLRQAVPDPALATRVEALVEFVERARYARAFEVTDAERSGHVATLRDWTGLLAGSVSRAQARRAQLWPRSVWSSPTGTTVLEDIPARDGDDELVDVGQ